MKATAPRMKVVLGEAGELDGAAYVIRVPENWNGTLLVYAHGYPQDPVTDPDIAFPGDDTADILLADGYALAASGFRGSGMNLWEGMEDSKALVEFFEGELGVPDRVILYGISMGSSSSSWARPIDVGSRSAASRITIITTRECFFISTLLCVVSPNTSSTDASAHSQ